ncbi:hypothetical protein GGF46_000802 [Coemansia sp. RSA 552]|nr:hypothetical protein GGF46_000802 [Coemansia sp. RSA 552]
METSVDNISMPATVWMIASSAFVFLMLPGLGYFYGGMVRSKNALSLVFLCMMSLAVVTLQWVIFGYSLALSETATNPFIGNMKHWLFLDVEYTPHPNAPTVPGIVYALYQCMFAALTPALAIGGAAERIRVMPTLVFFFIWSTIVYDPIAYWVWAPNGWLFKMGVIDFAGGCAVETASGFAALAFYFVLGKRKGFGEEKWQPHNYLNIILGCALLYFGWFGFNAGAASLESGRAGIAFMTTNLAAAAAGLTWVALAYRVEHKFSSFHFCSGAVAGMVCVTPAASYVSTWAALPMGFIAGVCCYYMIEANLRIGIDDCIDVLAVHGIGGLLGVFLTGVFADKNIIALDGIESDGGLINGNGRQLYIQLAALAVSAAWSFVVTFILLKVMNLIPMFRFRIDPDAEEHGVDFAELGEAGYSFMHDVIQAHPGKHSIYGSATPSFHEAGSIQHPHQDTPMVKESKASGNTTTASETHSTPLTRSSTRSYPL